MIQEYIYRRYPDLVTIREIRGFLRRRHKIRCSDSDLYVYVNRLYRPRKGKKRIDKRGRGLYIAVPECPEDLGRLEDPPIELHGIKIEARLASSNLQKGIEGITSLQLQFLGTHGFQETSNKRFTRQKVFLGRIVTLTVHKSGFIEVFINCSNSPLDWRSFKGITDGIFNYYLSDLGVIVDKKVRQADIARDFLRLRLDGVRGVTLKVFSNSWFKIYQKSEERGTRIEARLISTIDLEKCIMTLADLTRRDYLREPDKIDNNKHPEVA